MNEPFVPLSKANAPGQSRSDLRIAIVTEPEKLRTFQPLGQSGNKTSASSQCEPRMTLQRDGDRISTIRIQCTCGQVIELACIYQVPPV